MASDWQFQSSSQDLVRNYATIKTKSGERTSRDGIRKGNVNGPFSRATNFHKDSNVVDSECNSDEEILLRRVDTHHGEMLGAAVVDQTLGNKTRSLGDISAIVAGHQIPPRSSVEASSVGNFAYQANNPAVVNPYQQNLQSDSLGIAPGVDMSPGNPRSTMGTLQHTTELSLQDLVEIQTSQSNKIIDILTSHHADLSAEVAKSNALQEIIIAKQDQMASMQNKLNEKQDHIFELQKEMRDIQKLTLVQLNEIQDQLKKIFTQNYELLEYPIPRLFIILPREPRFRDRFNPFEVPFKLYFLCECGSHTMGESTSTPHKIHIAQHDGYDVERPSELLKMFGSYILAVLQIIKYGAAAVATVVKAPIIANIAEQIMHAPESIKNIKENLENFVDDAISILQSKMRLADPSNGADGQHELDRIEAIEGADLRQLEFFLSNKDTSRSLGNLYRTVTDEGHVKWVCYNHYRENYKEAARRRLQDVVKKNGGEFHECEGLVDTTLSLATAEQFYSALQKAHGIHELRVRLDWDASFSDLQQLEKAIRLCNVCILKLDASAFKSSGSIMLKRGQRFDPLIEIMTNGHIRSFELLLCRDFFKKISQFPQGANNSTLQNLKLTLCDLRTTDDALNLFNALPRVKQIQLEDKTATLCLSRTENALGAADNGVLQNHLSARNLHSDSWWNHFGGLFKMNIVHFETDIIAFSKYGLESILSKNQQLETLTVNTANYHNEPEFLEGTARTIQQSRHPLRLLILKSYIFSYSVSVGFNCGHIISGTLEASHCGTIELIGKSVRMIQVRIEANQLIWGFNDPQFEWYDGACLLPVLIALFPELQVQEIDCYDLNDPSSYSVLHQLLELSKVSLARLTLKSSGADWVRRLKDNETRNRSFPSLSCFIYHHLDLISAPNGPLTLDEMERQIDWLLGILPSSSSPQNHRQKIFVELKNMDFRSNPWNRLLDLIDFQSLHELKLFDCTFTGWSLSELKMSLDDASTAFSINNAKEIGATTFIESFAVQNEQAK